MRCLLFLSEVTFDCGVLSIVACLFKCKCEIVDVCVHVCVLFVVFVHRPPATMSALFFLPPFAVDGCLAPEILDKKMGELWMEESMTNWDDMGKIWHQLLQRADQHFAVKMTCVLRSFVCRVVHCHAASLFAFLVHTSTNPILLY